MHTPNDMIFRMHSFVSLPTLRTAFGTSAMAAGMASMLRLRHRQKRSKLTVKFAAYTTFAD
jgi:hypothetical protein